MQIRADQQQLPQRRWTAVRGESLVGPRQHAGQTERRREEPPRQPIHLLHVIGGVAADPLRVGPVGGPDLGPGHVFTVGPGDPKVARRVFESVSTHIGRGHSEATHRLLRVDHLAAGHSPAQERLRPLAVVEDVCFEPRLRPVAPQPEAYAEARRALHQKRQVEGEDVVVFEHVRITSLYQRDKAFDQLRFAQLAGIQAFLPAGAVSHADHEDAVPVLVEPGRLEVELKAAQVVKAHAFEVGATGQRQELLDRVPDEHQSA